jgi:hypothetical protein
MNHYRLSEFARQMTIKTWRTVGGCGLPNNTMALASACTTLGDVEDQCPYTGRSIARYAVERLSMPDWAVEIKSLELSQ